MDADEIGAMYDRVVKDEIRMEGEGEGGEGEGGEDARAAGARGGVEGPPGALGEVVESEGSRRRRRLRRRSRRRRGVSSGAEARLHAAARAESEAALSAARSLSGGFGEGPGSSSTLRPGRRPLLPGRRFRPRRSASGRFRSLGDGPVGSAEPSPRPGRRRRPRRVPAHARRRARGPAPGGGEARRSARGEAEGPGAATRRGFVVESASLRRSTAPAPPRRGKARPSLPRWGNTKYPRRRRLPPRASRASRTALAPAGGAFGRRRQTLCEMVASERGPRGAVARGARDVSDGARGRRGSRR